MRYLVLGVALVTFALWLAFNHERDRFRTCRAIGHGPTYCTTVWLFTN
jgi:hypothetical protein